MHYINKVKQTKQALILRAKLKGFHEGFGQKEYRILCELLSLYDTLENQKALENFKVWLDDFDLSSLRAS